MTKLDDEELGIEYLGGIALHKDGRDHFSRVSRFSSSHHFILGVSKDLVSIEGLALIGDHH